MAVQGEPRSPRRAWRALLPLLAGALMPADPPAAAEPGAMRVFVSILPQKDFVERVAGARAEVSVLVGPGQSPATYEPTPRQIARLAGARIYFRIGVPFEAAWLTRIRAASPALAIVDTAERIRKRPVDRPTAGARPAEEGNEDPHVWTDPALVKVMAGSIRGTLERLDPAHAPEYARNEAAFVSDLDALDVEVRHRLASARGKAFLAFHPSWGYFADAYGLRQIPVESGGKEPGPRTLVAAVEQAKALGIRVVLVQEQFSRRTAEAIAREIGGRVVAVDPLAEDYVQNLRKVAETIAAALQPP
jgi:zinc transport system substrate-binding protein